MADTISTTVNQGITLSSGGSYTSPLTITASGYVNNTGTGSAVLGPNTQAWTVVNAGTVSSYGTNSRYGISFENGGLVNNSGTIRAGIDGVRIAGAAGTLVNSGTILSRGSASYQSGTITINVLGGASAHFLSSGTVINSGNLADGVWLAAGGYVTNSSTGIIGPMPQFANGYGVLAQASAGTVVNAGTITGGGIAIGLLAGGSASNSGTVTASSIGIKFTGAAGTVSNSGLVQGGTAGSGVYLGESGYVANTATTGVIRGFRGVYVPNSADVGGTIVNHGTIEASSTSSSSGAGIQSRKGGHVTNYGTIDGNIGIGVYLQNQPSTLINQGLIKATGAAANGRQDGIRLQDNGDSIVINYGTVVGRSNGVYLFNSTTNGDTVVNHGLIQSIGSGGGFFGGTSAIEMRSHHSVVNYGTLVGQYGVYGSGSDVAFVTNSGTIIGTNRGVFLKGGGTITNSGTITGATYAVVFGGIANNLLILENGFAFGGTVYGATGATDTLQLLGTVGYGVTASYNALGLTNFENVVFGPNGYATLQITNSGNFTFGLTISGFDASTETINLTGIGTDGTITNFDTTTDQVTVTGSLGSATLQFVSIDGMTFTTGSDGSGGTALVACFAQGTLIRAPEGEVPVEQLAIGDRVVTASGAARPIKWIGRRAYDPRFVAGNRALLPIRIEAGALADGVPARDLFVSPEHAMVIDGAFLPARLLVNGATIRQVEAVERLEYFHIELDSHDVVFAEGATAESFADFGGRGMFHNSADFALLYPEAEPADWESYAALLQQGAVALPAIRAALLARAEVLGRVSRDPDLRLVVNGGTVQLHAGDGGVYRFTLPAGATDVTIASRNVMPIETEATSLDPRRLGVPVERIALIGGGLRIDIGPECLVLRDGFHGDEGSHRWTDGSARLPAALLAHFVADLTIELRIGATDLHYPIDERPAPHRDSQRSTALAA